MERSYRYAESRRSPHSSIKLREGRRSCCWPTRLDQRDLAPGEQQCLLMLTARGLATQVDSEGSPYWLLDAETLASLLESLAERGLPLRASRAATA